MKSFFTIFCVGVVLPMLLMSGCELLTQQPKPSLPASGDDLIINEVFTISPDKYYAYSWIELFNPTQRKIRWFDATYPATIFAVGDNGTTIRTEDDGQTWATLPNSITQNLLAINFSYPDTGFAVGEGGAFVKITRNPTGDYNFDDRTSINPLVPNTLRDVYAPIQSRLVLVCGDKGTIMRSINRGVSFETPQTSGTSARLNAMAFVDANRIYVVGDSGIILKSTVSGVWTRKMPAPSQTSTNFRGVSFISDLGWVVGDGGAIGYTANGGGTWKALRGGTEVNLNTVFFSGQVGFRSGMGWVAGDSGAILRTDDFGETWVRENSGTSTTINKLVFADSMRGWAYCNGGLVLNTTNGGTTWNSQRSRVTSRMSGSYILPLNITVVNYYQLTMWGEKRHFFLDSATGVVNFDVITKIDTGQINFILGIDLTGASNDVVPPAGFRIVNSDSNKFHDHVDLGPGNVKIFNLQLAFAKVLVGQNPAQIIQPVDPILWRLLSSGEIRLEKKYVKLKGGLRPEFLGQDSRVIDLVRYGNFQADAKYFPDEPLYPGNISAGFIPEWWSMARYDNDRGGDIELSNTQNSFYMTDSPIPGWYSQKKR